MNAVDARRVLALREIEAAAPGAVWSAADRDWATRAALQGVGRQAAAEPFLAERARLGLERIAPRFPALQPTLDTGERAGVALRWALPFIALLGMAVDSLGGSHHINLLAPPLWGVLAWNLVVYALLLHRLARPRAAPAGALVRWVEALRSGRARADAPAPGNDATLLRAIGRAWSRADAAARLARTLAWLHALAAALALGLIGGLYLRGLVFDLSAGWQSTFLDAGNVHALLSTLLAPAALLTGIELPDAAAFATLRDDGTPGAASAAAWIHLLAATLALGVVAPRALLAGLAESRARRLAASVTLPLHEPYFQRLLREQRGSAARVHLLAHAHAPAADALATLTALLGRVLGPPLELSRASAVEFGAEDDVLPGQLVPPGTTHALLLVDLAATPEAEHQGRLAARLAATAATRGTTALICIDEAAFLHRFAAWPQRATERRAAWAALAASCGLGVVMLDLGATGTPGAAAAGAGALQRALDAAAQPRAARAENLAPS
jgi:hypothetical protein